MLLRPPCTTRTDSLFPYPTLFRSLFRRTCSAAPSAGGRGISVERLRAVHQRCEAGRRSARRTLARLGQGGMRHPRLRRRRERTACLFTPRATPAAHTIPSARTPPIIITLTRALQHSLVQPSGREREFKYM